MQLNMQTIEIKIDIKTKEKMKNLITFEEFVNESTTDDAWQKIVNIKNLQLFL